MRAFTTFLLLVSIASAASPRLPRFKNLVTFGDSYTDVVNTGDGGVAWPVYAAGYAHLNLHPFAKSGATCSNSLTPRPFPPVTESQIPAFKSAALKLNPAETVFTLWIGTNDVGQSALLTGNNPGVSIVDTTSCAIDWVRTMHSLGARNFIFQNMIPLELTQLYSSNSFPNRFWALEKNATEWAVLMQELTRSGNALSKLMLQNLASTLRDSHIAVFDSHALFTDMAARPQLYLNGTAPLNVTGSINQCVFEVNGGPVGGVCPAAVTDGAVRDSFLWFDELHPSEQADRIVAREIVKAMRGNTRWATWLS